jgi:protein required for attachment to host cells
MSLVWRSNRWLAVVDKALVRLYLTEGVGSKFKHEAKRALELLHSHGYEFIRSLRSHRKEGELT